MTVPTSDHHDYSLAMQEYMHLQLQRDELNFHLDHLRPSPTSPGGSFSPLSATASTSSNVSSPATSPTRQTGPGSRRRHSRSGERRQRQNGSTLLDTIPDEETLEEINAGEKRLFDVDESIKRALTELLNCDAVRADAAMRMWVQKRLMETEKELRSGRRRRSSTDY